MKLGHLSLRDIADTEETIDGTPRSCRTSFMWLNWCPVDIVLWVLVVAIVLLVIWRLFIAKAARKGATDREPSARPGHRRLYCRPNSMTVDPYHIPRPFEDSLISKDPSYRHPTRPTSMILFDKKGAASPTAQTLHLEGGQARSPRPVSDSFMAAYTAQFDTAAPPQSPPPAYVRSPRWEI